MMGEASRDHYDLRNISTDGSLLDIGGHIGATAISFPLLHPKAHVYTFEPAPLNFFYMAWNLIENRISTERIHMYNAGLSSTGSNFAINFSPQVGSPVHCGALSVPCHCAC